MALTPTENTSVSATTETDVTTPNVPTPVISPDSPDIIPTEHPLEAPRLTPITPQPGQALYRQLLPGIMQVPADLLLAASRKSSLWPMTFGLAC